MRVFDLLSFLTKRSAKHSAGQGPAPVDYAAAARELAVVNAEILADERKFLLATRALREQELALMGRVIQTYCYGDLNARRIIDAVRGAALGPAYRNAGKLQDAQVFPKLKEAVADLPAKFHPDGIIRAADIMELHRGSRHLFAHWAARRAPDRDVLILYSKNEKEAAKGGADPLQHGQVRFGLMHLAPMAAELRKMEEHGEWLAGQSSRIEMAADELEAHYDAARAAKRAARYEAGKAKKGAAAPPRHDEDPAREK